MKSFEDMRDDLLRGRHHGHYDNDNDNDTNTSSVSPLIQLADKYQSSRWYTRLHQLSCMIQNNDADNDNCTDLYVLSLDSSSLLSPNSMQQHRPLIDRTHDTQDDHDHNDANDAHVCPYRVSVIRSSLLPILMKVPSNTIDSGMPLSLQQLHRTMIWIERCNTNNTTNDNQVADDMMNGMMIIAQCASATPGWRSPSSMVTSANLSNDSSSNMVHIEVIQQSHHHHHHVLW